jgi:hypothetical protein
MPERRNSRRNEEAMGIKFQDCPFDHTRVWRRRPNAVQTQLCRHLEVAMLRNLAFVIGYAVILILSTTASVWAADFGTAEEAKAMLERAVAAVKEDKAKALDMFNNGEGGFKDRDLYVFCANASDGIITAHPYGNKGKQLRDIEGKHGAPLVETILQHATEGTIKETTYWWPRPGTDKPFEKTSFYTKVGDQICGVGYYKG